MHADGPLSFAKTWEGFLPANTVLMARRAETSATAIDADGGGASSAPAPARAVRFAFIAPGLDSAEARELFSKIIAALGASGSDSVTASSEIPADVRSETTVRFVLPASAPASEWRGSVLETYSVEAMLAQPELKKTVWAQLKPAARGKG